MIIVFQMFCKNTIYTCLTCINSIKLIEEWNNVFLGRQDWGFRRNSWFGKQQFLSTRWSPEPQCEINIIVLNKLLICIPSPKVYLNIIMALYKKVAHICGFHLHVVFKSNFIGFIIWKKPEYSENSMNFP